MQRPVFSVIIPTYNRANLLPRAIQSTMKQTFENFELIIVDDASSDETSKIVQPFLKAEITYIRRKGNGGVAAALNTGVLQSKGELICFLGDDDEYLPQFLAETYHAFDSAPDHVGFMWCGIRRIRDSSDTEEVYEEQVWQLGYQNSDQAYLPDVAAIGTGYGLTVRRTCFDTVGLFDESLKTGSDTDFVLRLACNFGYTSIPIVLVQIHQHIDVQLTDSHYSIQRLDSYKRILQKNAKCLEKHPNLWRIFYMLPVYAYYQLGDKVQGRKLILTVVRKYPLRLDFWLELVCLEIFRTQPLVVGKRILHGKLISILLKIYRYFQKNY